MSRKISPRVLKASMSGVLAASAFLAMSGHALAVSGKPPAPGANDPHRPINRLILSQPSMVTSGPAFQAGRLKDAGSARPFFSGYRPQFYFRTQDVTGNGAASGRVIVNKPDIIILDEPN